MPGHPVTGLRVRWLAVVLCGLALVAGGCGVEDESAPTTVAAVTTAPGATPSTLAATTTAGPSATGISEAPTTTAEPALEPLEGMLTVGVVGEIVAGNIWEFYDEGSRSTPAALIVYDSTVIDSYWGGRPCGWLAATDDPEPVWEGDHWTVTIPLREGVRWSDGEAVSADDYVFTMEVIEEFDLGGYWLWWHPVMIPDDPDTPTDEEVRWVESVRAPDDHTIELVFSPSQNLPDPLTYADILRGNLQPEHFWRPIVAACRGEDDPRACLYAADPTGQPVMNLFDIESWGTGEVILAANPDTFWRGITETEYANGALVWSGGRLEEDIVCGDPEGSHIVKQATIGPFVEKVRIVGYGSPEEALDAFLRGDLDFTPNLELGSVSEDYRRRVLDLPDLTVVANPTDAWEALWFNLRKPPMNDLAFRQALAYVIDKEAILDAAPMSARPIYTLNSPYTPLWYTDDVNHWGRGMTDPERLDAAVAVLSDAGYTWTSRPQAVTGADGEHTGEIIDGEGLTQPDGTPVPELEYLMPADRAARRIAGEMIPQQAARLGITITWQPTDIGTIISLTDDELGWDLVSFTLRSFGVAVWPCGNHQGLFGADSDNALAITGYDDPEFEALSDALDAAAALTGAARLDQARPICAAMEANIADNLPVIVEWSPLVTEFWPNTIDLPDTERLYGLGNDAICWARIRD